MGLFFFREAYYGNSTDAGEDSEKIIAAFYWCKFTLMMHSDCHPGILVLQIRYLSSFTCFSFSLPISLKIQPLCQILLLVFYRRYP